MHVQALVYKVERGSGRLGLSTKDLEASPGDMLRDPQLVYEGAEEMGRKYRKLRGISGGYPVCQD